MITNEGRDYLETAGLLGGSQISAWYIGLYGNAHVPVATDTMITLLSDAGEITTYTGGARKLLVPDALVGGVWANSTTALEFAFATLATVRGGFITSNPTIGSTTGILLAANLNASPKTPGPGEPLKVTAGIILSV